MSIDVAPASPPLPQRGQVSAAADVIDDRAGQEPAPSVAAPFLSGEVPEAAPEPEPWLSPSEREAWLALSTIMFKLPGLLDQQLQRDSDLSFFEYMVLAVLAEQTPPKLRMSQLSALTNGSLSRLSHVAKRLETKKYIVRKTDAIDRRSTNAILTPAGLAKVRDTSPGHVAWVRRLVFDNITPDQVHELTRIAAQVRPTIDPDNELSPR